MSASERPSGVQVEARIREASNLSDLCDGRRLHGKIGMSPEAIVARLQEVSDLRDLCLRLGELNKRFRNDG